MSTRRSQLALLVLILAMPTIVAAYLFRTNNKLYSSESSTTSTISVSPKNTTLYSEIGKTFTINITITDADDLYAWQAGLNFNSTILETVNFEEGPFLKQEGTTLWVNGSVDNIAGIIHYHASALAGNVIGINGNGTLGTITFKVKNYGNSTLQLANVILLDSKLANIDKMLVDGSAKIRLPGDVNDDGIVGMADLSGISAHWTGPPVGPLGYDANFDINYDGTIDIQEVSILSAYWTGPPKGPMAP